MDTITSIAGTRWIGTRPTRVVAAWTRPWLPSRRSRNTTVCSALWTCSMITYYTGPLAMIWAIRVITNGSPRACPSTSIFGHTINLIMRITKRIAMRWTSEQRWIQSWDWTMHPVRNWTIISVRRSIHTPYPLWCGNRRTFYRDESERDSGWKECGEEIYRVIS